MDGDAIADRLLRSGVPAGPVLPVDEALAAPHTPAAAMVDDIDGYRGLGTPIKLSRTPGGMRRRPPRFAEHGDEVLAQHGFTPQEIAALKQDGVLCTARRQ